MCEICLCFHKEKKMQSNNTNSTDGEDELQVSGINAAARGKKKHCRALFKNINMYKIMHINFHDQSCVSQICICRSHCIRGE